MTSLETYQEASASEKKDLEIRPWANKFFKLVVTLDLKQKPANECLRRGHWEREDKFCSDQEWQSFTPEAIGRSYQSADNTRHSIHLEEYSGAHGEVS